MKIFTDESVRERVGELCKLMHTDTCDLGSLEKWLSVPPKHTVLRLNTRCHSKEDILAKVLSHLRQQYEVDEMPKVYSHPVIEDVCVVESRGQTDASDSTDQVAGHVIVGSLCGCAVLRGAQIYAPGIMGMPNHIKEGDFVSVYADIKDQCLKGYTKPFEGPKLFLGIGKALMSRQQLFRSKGESPPSGLAIEMVGRVFDCPSFNDLANQGLVMLQNLPSVLTGHVLNPPEGGLVLDMCAAPGGKTTHLAHLVGCKGRVIAFDKSKNKINQIRTNCKRLAMSKRVDAFVQDAVMSLGLTKSVEEDTKNHNPPFPPESFTHILLDAPCSGLGQRPQLRNNIALKELHSFPKLQKKLFNTAVQLLKPAGCLVYSTCTITVEENEAIVAWALEKYPQLRLEPAEPILGGSGLAIPSLSPEQRSKVQRFGKRNESDVNRDTIGFFIAKFIKE